MIEDNKATGIPDDWKAELKVLGQQARAYMKAKREHDYKVYLKLKAEGYYENLPVWAGPREH